MQCSNDGWWILQYLLNSKKLIVVYCLNCVVVVNDEAMILTTLFHKKVITFIFDVSSIYSNISANSHPLLLTNRGWYESYKISHLEKYQSVNVKKLDEYYHCTLITTYNFQKHFTRTAHDYCQRKSRMYILLLNPQKLPNFLTKFPTETEVNLSCGKLRLLH